MSEREKAIQLLDKIDDKRMTYVVSILENLTELVNFKTMSDQQSSTVNQASSFGIAHKYANPELIEKEEGAFERAIIEKYETD